jgi:hypothetical protein
MQVELAKEQWGLVLQILEKEAMRIHHDVNTMRQRKDIQNGMVEEMLKDETLQQQMLEDNISLDEMREELHRSMLHDGLKRYIRSYERPIVDTISEIKFQLNL